ncbi:circumsporozoite protein-like isoform X2 [Oryza brachyantha]|uniref:circumsporozoite protein-like isoform X2 n=1 Tax=Oryza brachyantha TaxID=4533 RepID=UPI0007765BA0|nr:circumsporozoite protein-like isoform X2 [Oryza brachyantha]
MEDSVGEEERREQEEAMAQGKERGGEDDAGGESGFLSTVASKIGAAMSGGAEEDGEGNGDGNVAAASGGGEEQRKRDGDGGGGGIFVETEEERNEVDEQGQQAGILGAVASKIGVAMSGANGHAKHGVGNEDDARMSNGDAADHSTAEEKGDGQNGGGIMKQLISNLPTDDQAPDAEEASLLIAIIDD